MKKSTFILALMMLCTTTFVRASEELKMCGVVISDAIASSAIVETLNAVDGVTASGGISYDPETHTLTLNNASIVSTASANVIERQGNKGNAVTINLIGTNTVQYAGTGYYDPIRNNEHSSLTITGEGSLNLLSGVASRPSIEVYYGKVYITNTTVVANTTIGNTNVLGGRLYITNSNVTAPSIGNLNGITLTDCYLIAPKGAEIVSNYNGNGASCFGVDKKGKSGNIVISTEEPAASYTITITQPAHGKIEVKETTIDLSDVPETTLLHFIATPDDGYEFEAWSGCNADGSLTVTADATVTCTFKEATRTVTIPTLTNGSIVVTDANNNPVDISQPIKWKTDLTFTAVPNTGYKFAQYLVTWEGESLSNVMMNPMTLTLNKNVKVQAIFTAVPTYAITLTQPENGTIAVQESVDLSAVTEGTVLHFTATPDEGYELDAWSGCNADGSLTVSANATVTASFKKKTFVVTLVADHGQIIVENQGINLNAVEYGTALQLNVIPDEGYVFSSWQYSGSASNVITANTTITAIFAIQTFQVTFVDWNDAVLKEAQTVNYGEAAVAPEDPEREGYKFTGWDQDFSSVKANMTVKAQYEQLQGIGNIHTGDKSVKVIENGQLLILRNGKTFNATGAEVK